MPPVSQVPPPFRPLGLQRGEGVGERMVGWSTGREGEGQERLPVLSGWAGRGGDTGEDMLGSPRFSEPTFGVSLISSIPLFAAGI